MKDFINAIKQNKKVVSYRIHAELKNNTVGITAWYTKESIELLKEEIIKVGGKIIKIEKQTN